VSNATPLIYLAKIKRYDLLKSLYEKIIISQEVKIEIVDEGKKLKKSDALLIEKEIKNGFIEVKKVEKLIETNLEIEHGELSTLSLAKQLKIGEVLIDETLARMAAKIIGLVPKGTLYILLKNLKLKKITFNDFLNILNELIESGFRLKEEIYIKVIQEAKKI
jgi:predicted nucleic acid-binding protein